VPSPTGPLVQQDFRLVQGDARTFIFPVYTASPYAPFPITGYSARFVARKDYGDAAGPVLAFTASAPSPNGSAITIVPDGLGSNVPNSAQVTLVGADTALLTILQGQRMTRYFYEVWIAPPGGDKITLSSGALNVWSSLG
jgi:hypothetical protein